MGVEFSKNEQQAKPAPQQSNNTTTTQATNVNTSTSNIKTLDLNEVPYTNYSVGKGNEKKDIDPGIITVTANPLSKYEDVEPEILALRKIPYFTPLLKTSSFSLTEFFSNEKEASALDSLKPDAVLAICQMYQKHMKKSALTITHDQKLLATNLKRFEGFCQKVSETLLGKQIQTQNYTEQFKQLPTLQALVEKTSQSASKAIKSLEYLNNLLPKEERLEPISVHIPYNKDAIIQPVYISQLDLKLESSSNSQVSKRSESNNDQQTESNNQTQEVEEVQETQEPEIKQVQESHLSINTDSITEQSSLHSSIQSSDNSIEITKFREELISGQIDNTTEDSLVVRNPKKKKPKKKKVAEINDL